MNWQPIIVVPIFRFFWKSVFFHVKGMNIQWRGSLIVPFRNREKKSIEWPERGKIVYVDKVINTSQSSFFFSFLVKLVSRSLICRDRNSSQAVHYVTLGLIVVRGRFQHLHTLSGRNSFYSCVIFFIVLVCLVICILLCFPFGFFYC